MEKLGLNKDSGLKIGSSPVKGKLFLADRANDEVKILFKASPNGADEDMVSFGTKTCKEHGISEEEAGDIIDKAKEDLFANFQWVAA